MLEEINREIRIKEKWWLRKPNWKIFNKLVSKKSKKKKKEERDGKYDTEVKTIGID